ncbi:hypothetical protein [Streptomyces sp. NPDC045369]|uniref:hypothetical protein n=1 Tax=Streptomyces sp. NPDC045369 TaxID=3155732 RepID=UPI0033F8647C
MQCPRCQKLTRDLDAAVASGDRSKAADCRVLIGRHPDHDRPAPAPKKGKALR